MSYKKDAQLGRQIEGVLAQVGASTPFDPKVFANDTENMQKEVAEHFKSILEIMGANLNDDSLKNTPKRVAKMFVHELFQGLNSENFPACTVIENKMKYDEMITVKDIEVMSVCEHHLVTISGKAKIAYIPNKKILGLSKFNRVVNYFARRPQVQERLTEQIYYALWYILGTKDIAVQIKATHYCVVARGVKDSGSKTVTTKLGGAFMQGEVRAEFLKS